MLGRSPAAGEVVTTHLQAVVQVRGAEDILGEEFGIGVRSRLGVCAALLDDPTAVVEVADQFSGLDVAAGDAPTQGVVPVFPLMRYRPTGKGRAGAGKLRSIRLCRGLISIHDTLHNFSHIVLDRRVPQYLIETTT